MATVDIKMETVPKELYDDLLDKYNKLTEKYGKLMELYQNELDINSLASYNPLSTTTVKHTNEIDTKPVKTEKVTQFGASLQTEWKEGFIHDFNLWG